MKKGVFYSVTAGGGDTAIVMANRSHPRVGSCLFFVGSYLGKFNLIHFGVGSTWPNKERFAEHSKYVLLEVMLHSYSQNRNIKYCACA